MKPSVILIVIASAAAGAVLALAATDGFARQDKAARPSAYSNGVYGFSIQPPVVAKAEKDNNHQAAMFFAPAQNGFAANLNIGVQQVKMTLDDYATLSNGQFKQMGLKVLSEDRKKVSGRDAILWEYEGDVRGRAMKWIGLAVVDADCVYVITGTSAQKDEAAHKAFKASLDTFKLGD